MTPDGISAEDWDRVRELAAEIANATLEDDDEVEAARRKQLLVVLEALEEKYGELPSILATKADYSEDILTGLTLLERAHNSAVARGDEVNRTLTASSIAQIYIDELNDIPKGHQWLEILRACLERQPDESETKEWQRLKASLAALEQPE